jgi:hypothetical protein
MNLEGSFWPDREEVSLAESPLAEESCENDGDHAGFTIFVREMGFIMPDSD